MADSSRDEAHPLLEARSPKIQGLVSSPYVADANQLRINSGPGHLLSCTVACANAVAMGLVDELWSVIGTKGAGCA